MFKNLFDLLGVESQVVSHKERIISGVGAFLGIFIAFIISRQFVGDLNSIIIAASMGSSAVLLFAVPHGSLSQPWALLGGHTLSAIVGVACAQLIENQLLSASIAVGAAVTVMYYARCIHPPGGATALGAVVGGPAVHELGYQFVITPILLNAVLMLIVAVSFNALFAWRRYPVHKNFKENALDKEELSDMPTSLLPIAHEDFVYALTQIDTFIDVSESDLLRIYELATRNKKL